MGRLHEFVDAALAFPTVLFSFPLIVVVGYWIVSLLTGTALGDDAASEGAEAAEVPGGGGFAGFLAGLGLGGVPVAVTVSLLVAVAWFASLTGAVLAAGTPVLPAVPVAAVACAWLGTRLLTLPLRRAVPKERVPSRADFVGRTCVIRTGRVGRDFGQAEVTSPDGSSALVQVRQTGGDVFGAGSTALIFAYDAPGEFFWVMPYDAELDPDRPI
ncbi:hypothetical protein [Planomonospora parontospora]|uniref:hypothetical protein n=1 Tax=Planomonospora parontospora TaxID=58119 RepID=UPI0019A84030|nr:hypothetical protein [Planomonospora parontospora]GGL07515.1 hypothetical protein GCM10014719_07000 [Planomonospora parontospora subsp. antibiotica]GII14645.1 hypothetical protein Ppa05_13710 [Planomonospora parontospora subsp. antibiotica]